MRARHWGILVLLSLVVLAITPQRADAKGIRAAFKGLLNKLFRRKHGDDDIELNDEKKGAASAAKFPAITRDTMAPASQRLPSYERRPAFNLLYGDLGRYGSEEVILELEAGFHNFAANLYQGQLMIRGAMSRLATAIKRVTMPIAAEHARSLWHLRQRAVNLYFDSRVLALRCLYIAYFPIPATEVWDTRDIAYRRRKLVHFLGTYYMLDARLSLLLRFMKGLLSTVAEVFTTQRKGSKLMSMGQLIQTSGLYLIDAMALFSKTLAGLKEAVVAATVFPHLRERAYRALHLTGLDSHQMLNVAKNAIDSSVQFRRGRIEQVFNAEADEDMMRR
ncbi:hypothetical protein BESB_004120 [Besnoitia besnoiti]|uniref:Transmembrane protein n=1 Tax=Besnoitia besnoiti TaxID=94643 RepID=A0A2A9MNF7_BESBE|nr:hypothetical protein BESB_004120 [Besnoitia besnoiti]PFH38071.1 hypothetical protein BESB_004120 [Besnoitia besnoiti]